MRTYKFENINNIYANGSCNGELKTLLNSIKSGLKVKPDDEEPLHPKEIERRARKEALKASRREMEHNGYVMDDPRNLHNVTFGRNNPFSNGPIVKVKKSSLPYSNSLFIFAGDCGIGFNNQEYYEDLFAKFNKILEYNNTFVIFVRGNHDDPSYFDGQRINLSNVKAVPDYSVIQVGKHNILCVGGAISVDRMWRIKQEERINMFSSRKKQLYWKDEAPIFDKCAIDEISKEIKIDCVISHTAPSFTSPGISNGIDDWLEGDVALNDDMKNERQTMDRVFECLRDNGMKPIYWAYGHFEYHYIEKRSNTVFRGLRGGFNPVSIDMDLFQFERAEEAKKMEVKKHKKIKILNFITDDLPDFGDGMVEGEHGDDMEFGYEAEDNNGGGEQIVGAADYETEGFATINHNELRETIERFNRGYGDRLTVPLEVAGANTIVTNAANEAIQVLNGDNGAF